ncbi:hypothetical protein C0989_004334 [Termitomyces sp. Mn162]|nr:hypothetical protein C0989_004334 [Termitomyces sp. Mn162]
MNLADKNMFVHFTGGRIGHQITQEANHVMQKSMEKAYFADIPVSSSEDSDDELLNLEIQAGEALTEEDVYEQDNKEDMSNEDGDNEDSDDEQEYFEEFLGFGAL